MLREGSRKNIPLYKKNISRSGQRVAGKLYFLVGLRGTIVLRHAIAGSVLLLCAQAAIAATTDEIRILLEQGKPAEAYQQGKQSPERLGDPEFDFYFGIAAIDVGHAGEGVLALERYVLTFPDNKAARLQLARGYFALGEDARAREEFEALRKLNPPADVTATIDRYLDQVRLRETRYQTSSGFYVETGLGIDTNVNAGVSNPNIFLPNLGNVVVGSAGTKTRDSFLTVGVGGYISHPVAPGISIFGNGQLESKRVRSETQLSQGNYSFSGGVSFLEEKNLFRAGVDANLITIGKSNEKFRSYLGLSGEWQHQLDELQSVSMGAQLGALRYITIYEPKDATAAGISAGYRRLFSHKWQPLLTVGINVGRETALAIGRDDLSSRVIGARIGVGITPASKWGVSTSYNIQRTNYQGQDAILGVTRSDTYHSLDATVTYLYSRELSFRMEANVTRNFSNIALYEFPRETLAFKARYEFK
jgi:hypothetical protein